MAYKTEVDLYADNTIVARLMIPVLVTIMMVTILAAVVAVASLSGIAATKRTNDLKLIDVIHKMGIEDIRHLADARYDI